MVFWPAFDSHSPTPRSCLPLRGKRHAAIRSDDSATSGEFRLVRVDMQAMMHNFASLLELL